MINLAFLIPIPPTHISVGYAVYSLWDWETLRHAVLVDPFRAAQPYVASQFWSRAPTRLVPPQNKVEPIRQTGL